MKLSQNEAVEILKNPRSKNEIESVKLQESQLRVFTEEMDKAELCEELYWTKLTEKMKTRLEKKFERVFEFSRYPLPITQISDSILTDFFKVFDGKNRHFNIDGDRDLSVLDNWIKENSVEAWVEEQARRVFKNKPCSFVVIDVNESLKPYPILIDSSRIVDAEFDSKGGVEYIAFIHSVEEDKKLYSVYDSETFWVFSKKKDSDDFDLISSNPHRIGYCPAIPFISELTNGKNKFKRRVAFSSALSKMEDWTLFDIYRNFTDHYAPFPVTEAPKKKCPNPDCHNGTIIEEIVPDKSNPDKVEKKYSECPVCKKDKGNFIGPGTHIGINVKADKSQNDGSGVFKMIFPDTDKLEYVPNKLDELEIEIRHKTVGLNYMNSINEAVNQLQLKGSFSSMESVLLRSKDELDRVYKWIVTTVARIYYKDIQIRIDANFGTEYYLVSEDDLQKRFDNAKKIGLPIEEQMMIYLQLIETKYKGNPNKIERQKMLLQLDPMPLMTIREVIDLNGKNLVNNETLSMKLNFVNFVNKFEAENSPITQFGLNIPPEKRIEAIKEEFKRYNSELISSNNV